MLSFKTLALAGASVALFSVAASAAAADVAAGKALVQKDCTACHGTEVFSRPNHRMQSLAMLKHQIGRCQHAAAVHLTAQQIDDIAAYLDQTFYKFKK